jgi:hypothetical protein
MPILSNQASRFIGGGRFTPNKLAGLALWLKADAITGLNDGDAIGTWTDSSGNGRNATQGTAGAKPTYKTNIIGGKPVARFDGGDRLDNADVALSSTGYTIFCVASVQSLAEIRYLFDFDNASNVAAALSLSHNATRLMRAWHTVTGYAEWYSAAQTVGAWITISQTHDTTLASDECKLWINGAVSGSKQTDTNNSGNIVLRKMTIGNAANTGAVVGYIGDIAEIIIYDSALSDANRQAVDAYLSAKYGIALA